jgi:hypothetical protein
MKSLLILLSLLMLVGSSGRGGEDSVDPYIGLPDLKKKLNVPTQFFEVQGFNPATYLSMFTDEDIKRFVGKDGKATDIGGLTKLFIEADRACLAKYHQTYHINKELPIFRLLVKSYPELRTLEGEPTVVNDSLVRNALVRLDDIAKTLRATQEGGKKHPTNEKPTHTRK